ncbi:hypothetical protein IV203_032068 [Nitzschia inconspicua]|uniref:Uncharacterized protein n=1 Tax=Nitzschia inconspicua TaxID=303405 RepID=A0A9K3Q3N3_9STRA|nr:hypothetical protein IV203_011264 [Nitzschia inconspicua]KAG7369325.1 hypothetical protein IV203_032068 [Nitzschia inconspicua]
MKNFKQIGFYVALNICAKRLAAIWISAGVSIAIQLIGIACSAWSIFATFVKASDGDCFKTLFNSCETGKPPKGSDCNSFNPCTTDTYVCENDISYCSHTPVQCLFGTSCDQSDGSCKPDDGLVPCVAVIDEDDSFGSPNQYQLWESFRQAYPVRPFRLLVPNPEGGVTIPSNFQEDPYTVVRFDVVRDYGRNYDAEDWMSLCGLQDYDGKTTSVGFVGLFLDDSGSLKKSEVIAFLARTTERNIQVKEVVNGNENWI